MAKIYGKTEEETFVQLAQCYYNIGEEVKYLSELIKNNYKNTTRKFLRVTQLWELIPKQYKTVVLKLEYDDERRKSKLYNPCA